MDTQQRLLTEAKAKNRTSNVMIFLSAVCDLAAPVTAIWLVSQHIQGQLTKTQAIGGAAGLLCVLAAKGVLTYLATWSAHRAAYSSLAELRVQIADHLHRLPLGFFQTRSAGDLTNVVKNDVEQVELYLAHGLPETIAATAIPVVALCSMLVLDWRLALAMTLGIPIMWLIKRMFAAKWAAGFKVVADFTAAMQNRLIEYIAAISVIKAFDKSENKTETAIAASRDYVRQVSRSMNDIAIPMGLIQLAMESGVVLVIGVGLWLLQQERIDAPRLILAIVFAGLFTSAITKTATLQHVRFVFEQAMKGVGSIMNQPIPPARPSDPTPNGITVRNLTFGYPNKPPVLQDINLRFPAESTTAIVGPSGCGKSTLAHLIMGFWQPDQGSITAVDPRLISLVDQNVFLFNISLEDNIRIGDPTATREQIIEAARKAQVHELIESLPEGYETCPGESGVKLSGGERQRIAIARAILKDAPMIILDEATSAIDTENEALIQAAIGELAKHKTVIAITHHVRTAQRADQIVVMDSGRVIATGTHPDLVENCALYREMFLTQQRIDSWSIRKADC